MMKDWSILELPGEGAYIVREKPVRDFINKLLEEREQQQSNKSEDGK